MTLGFDFNLAFIALAGVLVSGMCRPFSFGWMSSLGVAVTSAIALAMTAVESTMSWTYHYRP